MHWESRSGTAQCTGTPGAEQLRALGIQERNSSMFWESRGTAQYTGNPGAEQISVLGIHGGNSSLARASDGKVRS